MSEKNVGLVNFFTNNSYGSIYRFCPSKHYIEQLKTSSSQSYYTSNNNYEYNKNTYELLSYTHYFKENYHLNIIGYIDQAYNFYVISKFLNRGLTFMVLNMSYISTEDEVNQDIDLYMSILKKNAPDAKIAFLLRYPKSKYYNETLYLLCNTIKDNILKKYQNCFDVLIYPFNYQLTYDDVYSTFTGIKKTIHNFYKDENHFVKFNDDEQNSAHILFNDPVLKKKNIYTDKTIKAICNDNIFDTQKLMDKLVQCGLFNRFPGVSQYFFKNENNNCSIIPLLLNMTKNSSYKINKKQKKQYYLSSRQFKELINQAFHKKIPMSYRLILKLLSSLKFGRSTLSGEKIYLRLYDYTDFGRYKKTDKYSARFLYNL